MRMPTILSSMDDRVPGAVEPDRDRRNGRTDGPPLPPLPGGKAR